MPKELMTNEAQVAARWWADTLRYGAENTSVNQVQALLRPMDVHEQQIADCLGHLQAREHARSLSAEQLDEFEKKLAEVVQKTFVESDTWNPEQPDWGKSKRVLGTDYGACDELRAVWQAVGGKINQNPFPIKTVMWISPGSVAVANGYGAKVVELDLA